MLSKQFLKNILNSDANEYQYVIFYHNKKKQYIVPFIKDYEHSLRKVSVAVCPNLVSENLDMLTDFLKDLCNYKFKQAFINFFIENWGKDEMLSII